MYIKSIELKNFRNYVDETIEFDDKINIILGKNGHGKTNILEGIYILSMGKSFRTAKDFEMVKFDTDFFKVRGSFLKDEELLEIEVFIKEKEKRIKIDGVLKYKNADLLENAYMVLFSPEDLKIVKEDPEKRRKFLDRELCQIRPLYYVVLSRYKKVLNQRNAILKSKDFKEDLLHVWNENLIQYGSKIIKERNKFIEKLKKISGEIHFDITNGKEILELDYESNVEIKEEAQEEVFLEKLMLNREKDIFRGSTSVGPHRDDFKISINGIDVRTFGSQGQQRTAALSLKLAEVKIIKDETGEDAIILLDDVLSELDIERQKYLIKIFDKNQIFISAAELNDKMLKYFPRGNIYRVENGKVTHM